MPTSKQSPGVPHALSGVARAAGHDKLADKLEVHHAIHLALAEQHRPLTPEEIKLQLANRLSTLEMERAQVLEYGTWVAVEDITVGNAVAYLAGHPVPVSNVERHGYDQLGVVRLVNPPPAGKDA